MVLESKELIEISGGGIKYGGVLTFLIGMVDGYLRPLTCNK